MELLFSYSKNISQKKTLCGDIRLCSVFGLSGFVLFIVIMKNPAIYFSGNNW